MQVIRAVLLVSAVFGSMGAAVLDPNERLPGNTLSNPLLRRNTCVTPPGGCSSAPGHGCDEMFDCNCIGGVCAPPMPPHPPPPPPVQGTGNKAPGGTKKTPTKGGKKISKRFPGTTMSNPLVARQNCATPPGGCSSAPGHGCDEMFDCHCIGGTCAPPMPPYPPPPVPATGNKKTPGGTKKTPMKGSKAS